MTEFEREAERRISIAEQRRLPALDLSNIGITELPGSLSRLHHVISLNLSGNRLRQLPEFIGYLRGLEVLDISNNLVDTLPDPLCYLWRLQVLIAAGNGLSALPTSIGELEHLAVLDVSRNRLKRLPESIGELTQLRHLNLAGNMLLHLPSSLQRIANLASLDLRENTDLQIPPELLGSYDPESAELGRAVLPATTLDYYFRTHADGARPLNEAKLILVGRGAVGKTSLVGRLVHGVFDPAQTKTDGIQITQWPILLKNNELVRLHVWDFGGQEIMHATHQFFLTERSLYVIVLSGREGGEDADVEYWLKLIETFGGDSPVIIALNKFKCHPFDLNRRGLEEKYGKRIRHFICTDCGDGTGIDEVREAIRIETDTLEHLRDRFPESWFSIKEHLSTMREYYVPFERFRHICSKHGEKDLTAQENLATALHCLGIALNFRDDARLRDVHVLNPHWVTQGIYWIINSPIVERQRGELHFEDLKEILNGTDYPSSMHDFLIGLMRKFELCFRFPEPRDDVYLIPELLGKEQPDLGEEYRQAGSLRFQYTYPVWPEGLLPRFIVRTHALSNGQHRWRTGVVLDFEGNRALVKADPQERAVSIYVVGPQDGRRSLLAIIRSDFERIHADLRKLNPIAAVPLPDDPGVTIPYEELRAYEREGLTMIPRFVAGKVRQIDVDRLLNSVEVQDESERGQVRLFISYSHRDDELRGELDAHLKLFQRLKLVSTWHDRRIGAGSDWSREIDENLDQADIIILLVSADFLASDYCYDKEMARALQRHEVGKALVVPVIVRDCAWQEAPFGRLQALPESGKAVRLWSQTDSAWRNVAEGIRELIRGLRSQQQMAARS